MSLFSRLFVKAQPPKIVDNQIANLTSQSQEFVSGIALGNSNESVRTAAIDQLGYGDTLVSLSGLELVADAASTDTPVTAITSIQLAAQRRIASLIDLGSVDFSAVSLRAKNKLALLSIAGQCRDAGCLGLAMESIQDPQFIVTLTVNGPTTKIRQFAAEAVQDPVQLKQLLKDLRGKDNGAYKIIKRKCDAINVQEKAIAEAHAAAEALCAAIERHSAQPYDAQYTPKFEHLNQQWSEVVATAAADLIARVEKAADRGHAAITKHLQAVASEAAQVTAVANADSNRQLILDQLRGLIVTLLEADAASLSDAEQATTKQLNECNERWNELLHYRRPNAADTHSFNQLRSAIPKLLANFAQHGTLQQQVDALAASELDADVGANIHSLQQAIAVADLLRQEVAVLANAINVVREREQQKIDRQAAVTAAIRHLSGLINKARGALSEGRTGPATGLRRAIEEKIAELESVPPHITGQLEQLDEKLKELQDWKHYAVAPKRSELIEQMEALIGTASGANAPDPNELAETIKRMQEEWKTLSRGTADQTEAENEAEWQRFHQAAQTAYQPCREYFAAQAKQRQDNLDKRIALLARLTEYERSQDWEHVNWRFVVNAIRDARQEWRSHTPTERAATKPVQEAFDTLLASIQTRIETEYAKNIDEKKALITRAQRLLAASTSDESRKALDEIKYLQLKWKEVGLVPHQDDQKLWAEFKQHCDAVYGKRQQQFVEMNAELDANKAKAIALCEAVEQLLTLDCAELLASVKTLPEIRAAFAALGELPRANVRDLGQRFDRALDKHEQRISQQRTRDKAQSWNNLLKAYNDIRLYRLAQNQNAAATELESLKQTAQATLDNIQHWPKSGLQALQKEFARTDATDLAFNEAALRLLSIRAEIVTEIDTPVADQALRRNYQMQRLMQSMGQGLRPSKEQMEEMIFEWIAIGPTSTPVYNELVERFDRCRLKAQR